MWLLLAIGASLTFGVRGVFYHWAAQHQINRNLMLFGVFISGMVGSCVLGLLTGQEWNAASLTGLMMGTFSFAANASLFKGFAGGKSAMVALLSGLSPVVVTVLAYIFWNEMLTGLQLLAFLLIMFAILITKWAPKSGQSYREGLGLGLLVMLFFGFNDTTAAWTTRLNADVFPTLSFMFAMGSVCFGSWWLADRRAARTQSSAAVKAGWRNGKTILFGLMVGMLNLTGMYLAIMALGVGLAGLVSAILAMNIVVILIYIHFFTINRLRLIEWVGVALALFGIVIVQLAE